MMILLHSPLISSINYSTRRLIIASRQRSCNESQKSRVPTASSSSSCGLCSCGRRHFLGAAATTPFLPLSPFNASAAADDLNKFHPPRPDWYEELSAWSMKTGMQSYEAEIADYKMKLFANLVGKTEKLLEIGIGTAPNLKYYATNPNISVFGLDPNPKMEKYARESASKLGLKSKDFRFIHAVGEAIPLDDGAVDAVIGTLVLCSVSDVNQTLKEIKRVLRPGGLYLFIEHVAAEDKSIMRIVQNVLDPLQQIVADGCHLIRPTGDYILKAGFHGGVDINKASLSTLSYLSSHVYGIAYN